MKQALFCLVQKLSHFGKKINVQDAYAVFKSRELFLINCRIEPYSHGTHANHEPLRTRKLLLHKKELLR